MRRRETTPTQASAATVATPGPDLGKDTALPPFGQGEADADFPGRMDAGIAVRDCGRNNCGKAAE